MSSRGGSGHGVMSLVAVLASGGPGSEEQQQACQDLQAAGQPGQTQRPAVGGADLSQTLVSHQPLCLIHSCLGVADVPTDTRERQEAWGTANQTTGHKKVFRKGDYSV